MNYKEVYDGLNEMFTDYFIDVGASGKDLEIRDKALEAVQIQISTKPIITLPNFKKGIPYSVDCPTCGTNLTHKVKRCWECGQLIDWSNGNDN